MTPPGRLQAMIQRLQAIDEAIQTVKPALQAFYNSLNDEQKARFNEIGPQLGQPRQQRTASDNTQAGAANCSSEKAGISNLAINRIEEIVRPTETQGAALDKLDDAMQKAVERLREACPNTIPQTPVGRLDVMQKRLEAMIDAANTVRPALEEFYASLNDEQKAKFNRLGREHRAAGRLSVCIARSGFRHCMPKCGGVHFRPALWRSAGNATFRPIFFVCVSGPRRCGESILTLPGPRLRSSTA